ncbi:hypothetical protein [Actinomadura sp. HBU206391]|uniref:hypothetical protein n=1 Tax=Actinomadura sp. HBU206391 TaxID=2731692 RepID=UPI00164FDC8A|nr:hypothetical protein [Actinomadura sp. HBU206391]MBC6457546.1 hypothetical protein [Actinomadura sp. HBU206391]
MLAWQLLDLSAPPDPNHGLGYAALMFVGLAVVIALLVTLIALVLHNLREEERRRHTH